MSNRNEGTTTTVAIESSALKTTNVSEIPSTSSAIVNVSNTGSKIIILIAIGTLICATIIIVPAVILTRNKGTTTSTSASTIVTTTVPTFIWNSTGITVAGVTGVSGTATNQLNHPYALFVDSSNSLYIADWYNNRIQKWLSGASTGTTVAGQANAATGTTGSYLNNPSGVVVDSSGNIYAVDSLNYRVQLWASGATSGTTVAGTTGTLGSANNQLDLAYSVSLDSSSGTIYIADYNNHRVMCYLSGASSGTVVAGGNGPGTGSTQLYNPMCLYFEASSNSLIIANFLAHNIVRWVIGASSWTLIAGDINGAAGSTSTLLNMPISVTADYMGNIYVADALNCRVQFFLAGQSNGTTIAGVTGVVGATSTLIGYPYGVALDSQLNLYVADTNNNRVQKFFRN